MQRSHALLLPVALAASFSFAARETRLALAPKEGLVLEKTGKFSFDMSLQEFSLSLNGEEMEIPEKPEITNASVASIVVTDTYETVADGRVTKLARSFDELGQEVHQKNPEGETDEEQTSELEGKSVVFTYSDEEDDYTVAFGPDDEGADEELLADLDHDMDFGGFLPEDAVDEGASWTIPASRFDEIFALGGDLKLDDEEDGPQEELIDEALEDNLEGEITCTFAGTRDVDGRELAVVSIKVEAEGEAEGEEDQDVGESGFELAIARRAQVELDLEGELLWDAEAGHFATLELAGTLAMTMREQGTGDFDGNPFEQVVDLTFEGTLSFELAAEAK